MHGKVPKQCAPENNTNFSPFWQVNELDEYQKAIVKLFVDRHLPDLDIEARNACRSRTLCISAAKVP